MQMDPIRDPLRRNGFGRVSAAEIISIICASVRSRTRSFFLLDAISSFSMSIERGGVVV